VVERLHTVERARNCGALDITLEEFEANMRIAIATGVSSSRMCLGESDIRD